MAQLADLLDALGRIGDQPGRPVSAHLDPALDDAARAAVALGLTESVSALTRTALDAELRRLALRVTLGAPYTRRPDDRPHVAEVALFLAAVSLSRIVRTCPPSCAEWPTRWARTSTAKLCWRPPWDTSRSLDPPPDATPQAHRQGEPRHLVLHNEALGQISGGVRPGRYSWLWRRPQPPSVESCCPRASSSGEAMIRRRRSQPIEARDTSHRSAWGVAWRPLGASPSFRDKLILRCVFAG